MSVTSTWTKQELVNIARVTHAANQAFRATIGEDPGPDFAKLPKERQDGIIEGVTVVASNPGVSGEHIHRHWKSSMAAKGWMYGDREDETKKTHPNMRDWKSLPEDQRRKDNLFIAIVNVMTEFA